MKRQVFLDFVIDKLTNSIENAVTGDVFHTAVTLASVSDVKTVSKSKGWNFNWREELNAPAKEVYKLTIDNNPTVIQGFISLEIKADHVFMHLLESAPFNIGKGKVYVGVAGNLVAHACRLAWQRGFEGNVSFYSKTKLVAHYEETLGAVHIGGNVMIIETPAALSLINKYFKN